jgi:hypothetical protein
MENHGLNVATKDFNHGWTLINTDLTEGNKGNEEIKMQEHEMYWTKLEKSAELQVFLIIRFSGLFRDSIFEIRIFVNAILVVNANSTFFEAQSATTTRSGFSKIKRND